MEDKEMEERNWSRDWNAFDWESVRARLEGGEQDIGMTEEEFHEFMDWYALSSPEDYGRAVLYILLVRQGIPEEKAEFLSGHMEELVAVWKQQESAQENSE
ncbi:MAG: hypothetical protein NC548_25315 [Lachnospiraceae bacterium]|nr:hypothetical protein [Lachnospiraceae bacterium]